MELINYDFESAIEGGFAKLFAASNIDLRIADDIDEGELPDECVLLELDSGGALGEQHQNAAGEYNHYSGTLDLTIRTPRVSGDQVATTAGFKSRHTELVARTRQLLEEIDSADITANWLDRDSYTVSGAGTTAANGIYVRNGSSAGNAKYTLSSGVTELFDLEFVNAPPVYWQIYDKTESEQLYKVESDSTIPPFTGWATAGAYATMDGVSDMITYATDYAVASRTATAMMRVTSLGNRTMWIESGGAFIFTPTATGVWELLTSTVAIVGGNIQWRSGSDLDISDLRIYENGVEVDRWLHAELESGDLDGLTAANSIRPLATGTYDGGTGGLGAPAGSPAPTLALTQNAISPTRIKPTGTSRENDERQRMTTLSYEIQFTIT